MKKAENEADKKELERKQTQLDLKKQLTEYDKDLMDFNKFVCQDFTTNLDIHAENLFHMIPDSCLQMFIDYMDVHDAKNTKKHEIVMQIA